MSREDRIRAFWELPDEVFGVDSEKTDSRPAWKEEDWAAVRKRFAERSIPLPEYKKLPMVDFRRLSAPNEGEEGSEAGDSIAELKMAAGAQGEARAWFEAVYGEAEEVSLRFCMTFGRLGMSVVKGLTDKLIIFYNDQPYVFGGLNAERPLALVDYASSGVSVYDTVKNIAEVDLDVRMEVAKA